MELRVPVNYNQVLEMVYQLPEVEKNRLLLNLQITTPKKQVKSIPKLQDLLLQAPTWTDTEYTNYLEATAHLNKLSA